MAEKEKKEKNWFQKLVGGGKLGKEITKGIKSGSYSKRLGSKKRGN